MSNNSSSSNLKRSGRHRCNKQLYHNNNHKSNHYYLGRDTYCPHYVDQHDLHKHENNHNSDDSCSSCNNKSDENGNNGDLNNDLRIMGVTINSSKSSIPPIVYSTINHLQKQCIAERQALHQKQLQAHLSHGDIKRSNRRRKRSYSNSSGSSSASCGSKRGKDHFISHPITPPQSPSLSSTTSSHSSTSSLSGSSSSSSSDGDESSIDGECGRCPSDYQDPLS